MCNRLEREREIKLYFATVKILAQKPTHINYLPLLQYY